VIAQHSADEMETLTTATAATVMRGLFPRNAQQLFHKTESVVAISRFIFLSAAPARMALMQSEVSGDGRVASAVETRRSSLSALRPALLANRSNPETAELRQFD
jgi:hypothetical protein